MADGATPQPVTRLLQAAARGDGQAAEELLPLVYGELRKLAQSRLGRTPPGQTLTGTALVHEAYVRLVGHEDPGWEGRGHFFFAAARAMRDILVEHARRKGRLKRGGDRHRVDPDKIVLAIDAPSDDLLALDEALSRLSRLHSRQHQVVMLRFFAGLTNEQTAELMGITSRTVERDWRFARASLYEHMAAGGEA
jgi:RNA polymerase sigma factor (TIGR02999 family)